MALVHLLPSIQPQSFLKWTRISSDQSRAKCYTNLLEKHQVVSEMFEVGICSSFWSPKLIRMVQRCPNLVSARQRRCWSPPSWSPNHDWTVPAVWRGHCHLGKLHRCSEENNVWIMGCTWLPNLSTYSLATIRPWRVIMEPTEYCTMILLPKPSRNLPVLLLEPGNLDCRLPWVFSKCKLFLM
jgi:hypothetical protein